MNIDLEKHPTTLQCVCGYLVMAEMVRGAYIKRCPGCGHYYTKERLLPFFNNVRKETK